MFECIIHFNEKEGHKVKKWNELKNRIRSKTEIIEKGMKINKWRKKNVENYINITRNIEWTNQTKNKSSKTNIKGNRKRKSQI